MTPDVERIRAALASAAAARAALDSALVALESGAGRRFPYRTKQAIEEFVTDLDAIDDARLAAFMAWALDE